MSDFKLESETDEERELQDIQKLKAALISDEPCTSTSVPRVSVNTFGTFNSKYEEYSKLETVLKLNKMYDDKLQRLEIILHSRLLEVQCKLNEINKNNSNNEENETVVRFCYVICGKPYFKDKTKFTAPDNEDTLLMRKSQMYDFSNVAAVTGWTQNDKDRFLNVLQDMSQEKKKMEFNSMIAELRRKSKGQSLMNEKKISTIKRKIDLVGKMQLKDIALPLDEEYDWDFVASKLSYRHNALEYRALWKLFLHPTINKAPWSKSEHTLLQKIASDEKRQDWKKIASLLGTGRTSYQCFVYYRTNMSDTITGKKWTKEEEEYLKRLIEYYKEDNYIPWGKVAASMDNRTKIQIYNKYFRLIEYRKGRFLKEEDAIILTCYNKFSANFKKMAKFLPGRSATQCRIRYQVLKKKNVSTVWSIDDDRKLVQLLCNQNSSVNYSSMAKHFPDKDRQNIRSRCLTLTNWMRHNPNVDIAKAPRRAARYLGHGLLSHDLNSAIERLKTRIESELKIKKNKKINMNTPDSVIDDAIIAVLKEEHVKIEEAKSHAVTWSDDSDEDQGWPQFNERDCNVQNLRRILTLLRAKLDKNKFLESPFAEKYKGLLEPDQDVAPVIKVKSYSRQNSETNLKVDPAPNIWGTTCLPPLTHVLPPNYSTITACRKIMSFASIQSETKEEAVEMNRMLRKNILLKDQTNLLMERFNTLFLWPMILANQPPSNQVEPHHDAEQNSPKKLDKEDGNAVALPEHKGKDKINHVIDLDESASNNDINLDMDMMFKLSNFDQKKF